MATYEHHEHGTKIADRRADKNATLKSLKVRATSMGHIGNAAITHYHAQGLCHTAPRSCRDCVTSVSRCFRWRLHTSCACSNRSISRGAFHVERANGASASRVSKSSSSEMTATMQVAMAKVFVSRIFLGPGHAGKTRVATYSADAPSPSSLALPRRMAPHGRCQMSVSRGQVKQ